MHCRAIVLDTMGTTYARQQPRWSPLGSCTTYFVLVTVPRGNTRKKKKKGRHFILSQTGGGDELGQPEDG